MCGIVAELGVSRRRADVGSMLRSIRSRGPDDHAVCESDWFALGFCRLTIFASGTGRQPVSTPGSEVTLAFNGEVYNFYQLAEDVESKYQLKVTSEAELLLALYLEEGLSLANRLDGDFAVVILDSRTRECHLLRDPLGVKPLYYAPLDGGTSWLVASEVRAFFSHPQFSTDWDTVALAERRVLGFWSDERTCFRDIRQVAPGGGVKIRVPVGRGGRAQPESRQYFDWNDGPPALTDSEDVGAQCARVVAGAVRKRIAHTEFTPVVVALSGGVDSSIIAALGHQEFADALSCVTLFDTPASEDLSCASVLTRELRARHHPHEISLEGLLGQLPDIVLSMGGGSPSYTAYLLGQAVRKSEPGAKVLLCGEGADEFFLGYWMHLKPFLFIRQVSAELEKVKPDWVDASPLLQTAAGWNGAGGARVYGEMVKLLQRHQLVNRHLIPFDHGTMAHGIECRVPFLDLNVVRWVQQIPEAARTVYQTPKVLLRILAADCLQRSPEVSRRILFRKTSSPAFSATTRIRGLMMDEITKRLAGSELAKSELVQFANGPEELFWLGATSVIFKKHRCSIDGMGFEDLLAEAARVAQ